MATARTARTPAPKYGKVREGLEKSLKAAPNLTDMDAAVIEATRALADKIDVWDKIVKWAVQDASGERGQRPAVPANDPVSMQTFLKALHEMGLTPNARGDKAISVKQDAESVAVVPDEPFDTATV